MESGTLSLSRIWRACFPRSRRSQPILWGFLSPKSTMTTRQSRLHTTPRASSRRSSVRRTATSLSRASARKPNGPRPDGTPSSKTIILAWSAKAFPVLTSRTGYTSLASRFLRLQRSGCLLGILGTELTGRCRERPRKKVQTTFRAATTVPTLEPARLRHMRTKTLQPGMAKKPGLPGPLGSDLAMNLSKTTT